MSGPDKPPPPEWAYCELCERQQPTVRLDRHTGKRSCRTCWLGPAVPDPPRPNADRRRP